MTLKTGRRCTWEEIEVGEVFAVNTCWTIYEKTQKDGCRLLESDSEVWRGTEGNLCTRIIDKKGKRVSPLKGYMDTCANYKLPKSVQALWKED